MIPGWAVAKSDDYAYYYTIHEWIHATGTGRETRIRGGHTSFVMHGLKFRKIEDAALILFDMAIRRRRVYPKVIYKKGVVVYSRANPRFSRVE